MKVKMLIVLTGLILFIQGCAHTVKIAPVATSDQKIGYNDIVTSQKKHFVALYPFIDLKKFDLGKKKTLFMVTIQNCGEEPISIGYGNVLVGFEENGKTGTFNKIKIQSLDEFMNDLKEEYDDNEYDYIEDALNDIITQAALQSVSSSSSSESSGSESEGGGGGGFMELKDGIVNKRETNDLIRETMPESVLKPQTLQPGQDCTGLVVCDTKDLTTRTAGTFVVIISVGGEQHRFTFNRSIL
jgi:hypothetical protein